MIFSKEFLKCQRLQQLYDNKVIENQRKKEVDQGDDEKFSGRFPKHHKIPLPKPAGVTH